MAPKRSSTSRKGSTPEVRYHDGTRGGSFQTARARLPPNINWEKLSPEKQKNCERAFTAASRRSDRDIDARYQSALTASDMHFLRTGKYLRVTRDMVINEEMYEEEDSHPRLWTSNLRQDADPRMAALNHQYQSIDMQFQAAFPGFNKTQHTVPSSMGSMVYSPTIPAPQFDASPYGGGYMSQTYTPTNSSSDDSSPPPMTDSASASPMVGFATPTPPHMPMNTLPSNASPATMFLPENILYPKYDPINANRFDHDSTMFDSMTDPQIMWSGPMPDEFAEFVNY